MSNDPPEPTKDEIITLRATAKQKIDQLGTSNFDDRDLTRIYQDDDYIRRFLMHHDNDQKLALEMVLDTLKWRKENKVNDITADNVNQAFFDIGALFVHNRDVDGCKLLTFLVAKHNKGSFDMSDLQKFLIYWLERLEREEHGKWITVFFDMQNAGLGNMDMEFIQYMINLFKLYYPWLLNYIIVYQMPWLLNAMWRIIKGWLPPKSIEKIKFITSKSALPEYVAKDQALAIWGGNDTQEYKFEREQTRPLPWLSDDDAAKKVHFSDSTADFSITDVGKATAVSPGGLLQITPTEELVFDYSQTGASASITLTNPNNTPVFFKVKTTSPEKFKVRPSVGVLGGGGTAHVSVSISGTGDLMTPAALVREKFLVMALSSNREVASSSEVANSFKSAPKENVSEVRLRVGVSSSIDTQNGGLPHQTAVEAKIMTKLEEVIKEQHRLQEQIVTGRRILFFSLALMVLVLAVLVFATNSLSTSLLQASTAAFTSRAAESSSSHSSEL